MKNIDNETVKELSTKPVQNKFEQIKACMVVLNFTIIESHVKLYHIDGVIQEMFIKLPRTDECDAFLKRIFRINEEHISLSFINITYSRETLMGKSIPTVSLRCEFKPTEAKYRGHIPVLNIIHNELLRKIHGTPMLRIKYVDKHTWTIIDTPDSNSVEIDIHMADDICKLNKIGVETLYCCEGHLEVTTVADLCILAKYDTIGYAIFTTMYETGVKCFPNIRFELYRDYVPAARQGPSMCFRAFVSSEDDKVLVQQLISSTLNNHISQTTV